MKQGIKKRWVEALRSGEYEQGRGGLQVDGRFCCLGVLCDLAAKEGVVAASVPALGGWVSYEGRSGVLPPVVSQWAGLGGDDPLVLYADSNGTLSEWNDGGRDFRYIADAIEAQPDDWDGTRG